MLGPNPAPFAALPSVKLTPPPKLLLFPTRRSQSDSIPPNTNVINRVGSDAGDSQTRSCDLNPASCRGARVGTRTDWRVGVTLGKSEAASAPARQVALPCQVGVRRHSARNRPRANVSIRVQRDKVIGERDAVNIVRDRVRIPMLADALDHEAAVGLGGSLRAQNVAC